MGSIPIYYTVNFAFSSIFTRDETITGKPMDFTRGVEYEVIKYLV